MRIGKVLSIGVVSLATIIVVFAAVVAMRLFFPFGSHQNFAPPAGQQTISPAGHEAIYVQRSGGSSFLYRKDIASAKEVRLTSAFVGIESEPSFSHDGKLVVYSYATSPDSKSEVWVVGANGYHPHRLTGEGEDALHPVFSPDDTRVFYGASSFTGHNSPIAAPARHNWDVFSVAIPSSKNASGDARTQVTHAAFYDLHSLDVSADGITSVGMKVLISTTAYPIGSPSEEFNLGSTGMQAIFQPHVPGEPSTGASLGEARFIHAGMDIVFLAATNTAGGNYDYNVYTMSDVTGAQIRQLTHLTGMTTDLRVLPDGRVTFVHSGVAYVIDTATQVVKPA